LTDDNPSGHASAIHFCEALNGQQGNLASS